MPTRVILAVVPFAMALALTPRAQACTCIKRSVAQLVCESPIIFEGEATKSAVIGTDRVLVTIFRVTANWKGAGESELAVIHNERGSMCGMTFESEHSYLVSAYQQDNHLSTGLCSLTGRDPAPLRPALRAIQGQSFETETDCIAAVDKVLVQ